MKKLTLLYKKLPCSNILRGFLFLFTVSCAIRDDARPPLTSLETKTADILDSPDVKNLTKLAAADDDCMSFQSYLDSPLGRFPLVVKRALATKKERLEKIVLFLDHEVIEFPQAAEAPSVCLGNIEAMPIIAGLVQRSVPSCHITYDQNVFSCALNYETASESQQKIRLIKRDLLSQVRRMPYLLSRRLTLAENLAFLLNTPSWEKGLASFCAVMDSSLPLERPMIFAAKKWSDALCKKDEEVNKFEIALLMLSKSVEEISFMHSLANQVSVLGDLQVSIPTSVLPASKKVWVKLVPGAETIENVMNSANLIRMNGLEIPVRKNGRNAKNTDLVKAPSQGIVLAKTCWFPGFSSREPLFKTGRFVELWGNQENSPCEQANQKEEMQDIASYLVETISAETTFELTESNVKPLSLPSGPYQYSVYEVPEKLGENLQNRLVDQGKLVWTGHQQDLVIARAANGEISNPH